MTEEWNADTAAERFMKIVNHLEKNDHDVFPEGPCSEVK